MTVEITPKEYVRELDAAIDAEREAMGKKPFDRDDDDPPDPPTREIQQSKTDPDSGQLHKEGKPDGFHYSEHRTVDSRSNVIVNVRVTAANVNDVDPIPEILRDIEKRLGHLPEYMGMDAGYHNARIEHQLTAKKIQGVIGYRRHTHKEEHYGKYRFAYDPEKNAYICPKQHELTHRTTNRGGYREYYSDAKICAGCPRRRECFSEKASRRQIQRHMWQDDLDRADVFTKSPRGRSLYKVRKQTIEPSFAEAKENHGFRYARMKGLPNMREQSFLTAAVQNMKRIALAFPSLFACLLNSFHPKPSFATA